MVQHLSLGLLVEKYKRKKMTNQIIAKLENHFISFLYSFKEQPGAASVCASALAKGGGKSILEHLREAGPPASD